MGFRVDTSERYIINDPNMQNKPKIKGHVRLLAPKSLSNGRTLIALTESRSSSVFGVVKDVLHTLGLIKYKIGFIVEDREGKKTYYKDLTREDYKDLGFIGDDAHTEMHILKEGLNKVVQFLSRAKNSRGLDQDLETALDICKEKVSNMVELRRELASLHACLSPEEIKGLADLLKQIANENPGNKSTEGNEYMKANYRLSSDSYTITLGLNRDPITVYLK